MVDVDDHGCTHEDNNALASAHVHIRSWDDDGEYLKDEGEYHDERRTSRVGDSSFYVKKLDEGRDEEMGAAVAALGADHAAAEIEFADSSAMREHLARTKRNDPRDAKIDCLRFRTSLMWIKIGLIN